MNEEASTPSRPGDKQTDALGMYAQSSSDLFPLVA